MKVANLVSAETAYSLPRHSYSSQPSPASSLAGSVRSFDEYREKPSQIATSTSSYFAAVNSSSTQLPLSPPADDQRKCSLPSISSLLEGVDCMPAQKRQRQNSDKYSRNILPPTPPLRPSSSFTDCGSPSARSHSASISSASSIPQSQKALPPISTSLTTAALSSGERVSSLSISSLASRDMPSPSPTQTSATTTATSTPFYTQADEQSYSRTQAINTVPSAPMTPSQAPPPPMGAAVNPGWPHHHYFPLSTAAASYPQNHERYVCRTCHKAFSRPSSLRIHSHSHTGEKPFRCTHAGCGKAFSVRSNMKRHERGCHSGRPLAATALV